MKMSTRDIQYGRNYSAVAAAASGLSALSMKAGPGCESSSSTISSGSGARGKNSLSGYIFLNMPLACTTHVTVKGTTLLRKKKTAKNNYTKYKCILVCILHINVVNFSVQDFEKSCG